MSHFRSHVKSEKRRKKKGHEKRGTNRAKHQKERAFTLSLIKE
jgi:hypothetical protein